jgi:hypothetical protein
MSSEVDISLPDAALKEGYGGSDVPSLFVDCRRWWSAHGRNLRRMHRCGYQPNRTGCGVACVAGTSAATAGTSNATPGTSTDTYTHART